MQISTLRPVCQFITSHLQEISQDYLAYSAYFLEHESDY